MVGADIEQLRSFAGRLRQRADVIEGLLTKLDPVIRDLSWVGADRDRFVEEWQQVHHRSLIRLVLDMRSASSSCYRHADVQDEVSR